MDKVSFMKGVRRWGLSVFMMFVLSFVVILLARQAEQNDRQYRQNAQQTAEMPAAATDAPAGEKTVDPAEDGETSDLLADRIMQTEDKAGSRTKNAIEKNFGKFYDYVDSDTSYETYFIPRYKKYRLDDLSQWKDEKGQWCYPEEYEFAWVPSDVTQMAPQQFPPELLEDMDTEELLSFILKGEKTTVGWGWNTFDNYLMGLSMYYQAYNYTHELMNRSDCAQVVHQQYRQYSEQDIKKYSKRFWHGDGSMEAANFQLVECLEWFFLALEGKGVPDEYIYGSELEQSLDNVSRPPLHYQCSALTN